MMSNKTYVIFDIETTGFSAIHHKITEIGAVKIEKGLITDEFHQLINPGVPIPSNITRLTGITAELLVGKPTIEEVLPLFMEFCNDSVLVAHNAKFDMGFIRYNTEQIGLAFSCDVLCTVEMSRRAFPSLHNHKLDTVCKHLGIDTSRQHRAVSDARATAKIFLRCIEY